VTAPRTVTRGRAFSRALRFAGPAVRRPRGSRGRVVRRPRGSPAPGFAGPCGSPAPGFAGPGDPGSHGLPPRRPLGLRLLAPIPSGSAFPRAPPSHADPSGSAFPRRFPRARPSRAVSLGLGLPAPFPSGSAFPRAPPSHAVFVIYASRSWYSCRFRRTSARGLGGGMVDEHRPRPVHDHDRQSSARGPSARPQFHPCLRGRNAGAAARGQERRARGGVGRNAGAAARGQERRRG